MSNIFTEELQQKIRLAQESNKKSANRKLEKYNAFGIQDFIMESNQKHYDLFTDIIEETKETDYILSKFTYQNTIDIPDIISKELNETLTKLQNQQRIDFLKDKLNEKPLNNNDLINKLDDKVLNTTAQNAGFIDKLNNVIFPNRLIGFFNNFSFDNKLQFIETIGELNIFRYSQTKISAYGDNTFGTLPTKTQIPLRFEKDMFTYREELYTRTNMFDESSSKIAITIPSLLEEAEIFHIVSIRTEEFNSFNTHGLLWFTSEGLFYTGPSNNVQSLNTDYLLYNNNDYIKHNFITQMGDSKHLIDNHLSILDYLSTQYVNNYRKPIRIDSNTKITSNQNIVKDFNEQPTSKVFFSFSKELELKKYKTIRENINIQQNFFSYVNAVRLYLRVLMPFFYKAFSTMTVKYFNPKKNKLFILYDLITKDDQLHEIYSKSEPTVETILNPYESIINPHEHIDLPFIKNWIKHYKIPISIPKSIFDLSKYIFGIIEDGKIIKDNENRSFHDILSEILTGFPEIYSNKNKYTKDIIKTQINVIQKLNFITETIIKTLEANLVFSINNFDSYTRYCKIFSIKTLLGFYRRLYDKPLIPQGTFDNKLVQIGIRRQAVDRSILTPSFIEKWYYNNKTTKDLKQIPDITDIDDKKLELNAGDIEYINYLGDFFVNVEKADNPVLEDLKYRLPFINSFSPSSIQNKLNTFRRMLKSFNPEFLSFKNLTDNFIKEMDEVETNTKKQFDINNIGIVSVKLDDIKGYRKSQLENPTEEITTEKDNKKGFKKLGDKTKQDNLDRLTLKLKQIEQRKKELQEETKRKETEKGYLKQTYDNFKSWAWEADKPAYTPEKILEDYEEKVKIEMDELNEKEQETETELKAKEIPEEEEGYTEEYWQKLEEQDRLKDEVEEKGKFKNEN